MATTSKPDLPSSTPRGPDRPGAPLRTTSTNYIDAQKASETTATSPTVSIPDGRKNSTGEALTSPVEGWVPNFKRRQSYKQEDLKREMQMSAVDGETEGEGTGFTERRE